MGSKIRDVLIQFEQQNFNVEDIASKTGASTSTVKIQLYKWKKTSQVK